MDDSSNNSNSNSNSNKVLDLDYSDSENAKRRRRGFDEIERVLSDYLRKDGHILACAYTNDQSQARVRFKVDVERVRYDTRRQLLSRVSFQTVDKKRPVREGGAQESEAGIHVIFDRNVDRPHEVRAQIINIRKNVAQGVRSGTFAIQLALALCARLGARTAHLFDASHIACRSSAGFKKPVEISLRALHILTQGNGWYDSYGFKTVFERVDAATFQKHARKLRGIRVSDLIDAVRTVFEKTREAIIASDDDNNTATGFVFVSTPGAPSSTTPGSPAMDSTRTLDTKAVLKLFKRSAAFLTAAKLVPITPDLRLGKFVSMLLQKDCSAAAKVVHFIFPKRKYIALLKFNGRPIVPKIPDFESVLSVWLAMKTYDGASLFLDMRRVRRVNDGPASRRRASSSRASSRVASEKSNRRSALHSKTHHFRGALEGTLLKANKK